MKLQDATVLITGANRGIGLAFARAALARGARKVYAAARKPSSITLPGVEAIQLDVTKPEEVAAAAQRCGDVTLLINNAGIAAIGDFLAPDAVELNRAHLETNFFGPMRMAQAFAPVLARQGGGGIINVLSVASWLSVSPIGAYSASKSAAWSLTNGLRRELRAQNTQVLGMHMGYVDTDMTNGFDVEKATPDDVVRHTLDALEAGAEEALLDELTRQVKQGLSAAPGVYLL
ncbi:MAG: short-chain dehydrogenase [Burkholderiales bacterium PBB1]|nr:MAG: short-chain dehydrogenase [Burkholderiales bacterium PBB1]